MASAAARRTAWSAVFFGHTPVVRRHLFPRSVVSCTWRGDASCVGKAKFSASQSLLVRSTSVIRRSPLRMLALPRKKLPTRTVDIYCSRCRTQLYKYHKGGKGSLVKCWTERIAVDYTTEPCTCPSCGAVFAKEAMVRGRPAYKIIGNRVYTK